MSQPSRKLEAAERKDAIVAAAMPVFARLGRSAATTKVIAQAAGVSEALLYRHFPTKDALYAALEHQCVTANAVGQHLLSGASPSTETLVMGVAVLVQAVFPGIGDAQPHDDTKRLVTASLLADGEFARAFLDRNVRPWIEFFVDCLEAARSAGDLEAGVRPGMAELWFIHHLANTLHLVALSGGHAVDYGIAPPELITSTVLFLLRGLGLKQVAIDRYYAPDKIDAAISLIHRD